MIHQDVLIAHARRGYAFLRDEATQWDFDVARLNPDTLDLSSSTDCALSQAGMRHYWACIDDLDTEGFPVTTSEVAYDILFGGETGMAYPTFLWEIQHGFRVNPDDTDFYSRIFPPLSELPNVDVYARLTDAWRQVIKENRDATP